LTRQKHTQLFSQVNLSGAQTMPLNVDLYINYESKNLIINQNEIFNNQK